jgi:hypothetical protein
MLCFPSCVEAGKSVAFEGEEGSSGRAICQLQHKRLQVDRYPGSKRPPCHEILSYFGGAVFLETFTHYIAAALKAGNAAVVKVTRSYQESLRD